MIEELSCVFTNVDVSRYFAFEINPHCSTMNDQDDVMRVTIKISEPIIIDSRMPLPHGLSWPESEEVNRNWMRNDEFRK